MSKIQTMLLFYQTPNQNQLQGRRLTSWLLPITHSPPCWNGVLRSQWAREQGECKKKEESGHKPQPQGCPWWPSSSRDTWPPKPLTIWTRSLKYIPSMITDHLWTLCVLWEPSSRKTESQNLLFPRSHQRSPVILWDISKHKPSHLVLLTVKGLWIWGIQWRVSQDLYIHGIWCGRLVKMSCISFLRCSVLCKWIKET